MLYTALQHNGPVAIRYPRGKGIGVPMDPEYRTLPIGKAEILQEGNDLQILAIGNMVQPSLNAAATPGKGGAVCGRCELSFRKTLR